MVHIRTVLVLEGVIGIAFPPLAVWQEDPGQLASNTPAIWLTGIGVWVTSVLALALAAYIRLDSGSMVTKIFRHPAGVPIGRSRIDSSALLALVFCSYVLVYAATYLVLTQLKLRA